MKRKKITIKSISFSDVKNCFFIYKLTWNPLNWVFQQDNVSTYLKCVSILLEDLVNFVKIGLSVTLFLRIGQKLHRITLDFIKNKRSNPILSNLVWVLSRNIGTKLGANLCSSLK